MSTKHAVIWIDHQEAKIFFIEGDASEALHAHKQVQHPRHGDGKHPAMEDSFFHAVLQEVANSAEILVVGPAAAKPN